jgi:hypothetical protein
MKKLIVLFALLCLACTKETKEDDPQVAQLKNSIAGTTWTYYYKDPNENISIYTLVFEKDQLTSNIDDRLSEKLPYRYEYPNLYIARSIINGKQDYSEYDKNNPAKIDPYKKEIQMSEGQLPYRLGVKANMKPYTLEDRLKIPLNTFKSFKGAETQWTDKNGKFRIHFQMTSGNDLIHCSGWFGCYPYEKDGKLYEIYFQGFEYPRVLLKVVPLKEVPADKKDDYIIRHIDIESNKYYIEDEDKATYETAIIKNDNKELEYNNETFYRFY